MSEKMSRSGVRLLACSRGRLLAAVAVALVAAGKAGAQTTPYEVSWTGTTGDYNDGANWGPFTAPHTAPYNRDANDQAAGIDNPFLVIENGGTAQVSADGQGAFLNLGMSPNTSGFLTVSSGTLTLGELRVGGREVIPAYITGGSDTPNSGGTGSVTQTGGTVNVTYRDPTDSETNEPIQSLYIGNSGADSGNPSSHADGTYSISNNAVLLSGIASDDSIVVGSGPNAVGHFNQSDTSSVTSTGFVTVARGGATAVYTMTGGTLTVGTGTAASSQNLRIGDGEYPTGNVVGANGTFTQSGGTVTVANDTTVGRNTGTGTYTMTNAGTTLNAGNNVNVGNNGTGTFNMGTVNAGTGPTLNITVSPGTNGMSVGLGGTNTSTGTFNLHSGTLNIGNGSADYLAVGDGTMATGTFNMDGGSIVTTDLIQLGRNNSNNDNRFNMSGGSITCGRFIVGGGSGATSGRGTFTLTNGTITASQAGNIGFGATNGTCSGTLDIQGGSLTFTGTGNNGILAIGNGLGNQGTVTQSGGTLSLTGTGGVIDIGRNDSGGSYTLSGTGNLQAILLRMADKTSGTIPKSITFNGGTSNITTLTLGNVGVMTINAGTHTIGTTNFSTGCTFNLNNISQTITQANFGTFAMNIGSGATLTLSNATTANAARTITKNGAGTLEIGGTQSHFNGSTLVETAGTVNMNSNANSGLGFTVSGGTMNVNAAQTIRAVTASGGTVSIGGNNVSTTGAVTISGGGQINGTTGVVTAGTGGYALQSGSASAILAGAVAATKTTSGTVTLSGVDTYTGGTTVSAGTLVAANADALADGALDVADGALAQAQASLPKAVTISTLTTHNTGQLDITNNAVVIRGTSPAVVTSMIKSGFNAGAWNGAGINSSTAAADSNGLTAIGYAANSDYGASDFHGVTGLTPSDVLVRYTYYGDADLDGQVTLDDFSQFLNGYQTQSAATNNWLNGDFDYDGAVTLDDFSQFLFGYQHQGAPLGALESMIDSSSLNSSDKAMMLAAVEAVPEPTNLAFVGLAAFGLGASRRRRRLRAAN